jgi:hypothetical protein
MKLVPGDIVEIEKDSGLCYVQVTHDHPSYPEVVRSLPGIFAARPQDLGKLARSDSRFSAMVPLAAAIEGRKISASLVSNAPVPEAYAAFPTFRVPIRDQQGDIAYWWLWDGSGLRYEIESDETIADLPLREVMMINAFLEKLD